MEVRAQRVRPNHHLHPRPESGVRSCWWRHNLCIKIASKLAYVHGVGGRERGRREVDEGWVWKSVGVGEEGGRSGGGGQREEETRPAAGHIVWMASI